MVHRYAPDILWNYVNYPDNGDIPGIIAEAINANPDVVMNDRWRRFRELSHFTTPEYVVLDIITPQKWETCRGIGYSFGYNQVETSKKIGFFGVIDTDVCRHFEQKRQSAHQRRPQSLWSHSGKPTKAVERSRSLAKAKW
jgi:hypothetical protein